MVKKEDWIKSTLGVVCKFENGDRGFNYPSKSDRTDAGIPFVNAGHLSTNGIDIENMDYISREKYNQLGGGKFKIGDLLFCLRGSVGKYAVNKVFSEGTIASSLVILRPNSSLITKFLMYYFGSQICKEMISDFGNGAAQPNLSAGNLKKFKISLPPVFEQQQIVSELDALSDIITKKKQQLEELDKLAQATFYDMFGDPDTNIMGLKTLFWKDVFDTTTGKLNANAMSEEGIYPFFTCSKQEFRINEYAFDCKALLLAGNNATANYDVKLYEGKFNAYQRTYVLTLKNEKWDYSLFKFQLENKLLFLQQQSLGANTKYLTLSILNKLKFVIPPVDSQSQFAKKTESVERQKRLINKSIEDVQQLFDYTMDKYFN